MSLLLAAVEGSLHIAIGAGAAGLALLTTGIILFAAGESPSKYALKITPTFLVGGGGMSFGLAGRF